MGNAAMGRGNTMTRISTVIRSRFERLDDLGWARAWMAAAIVMLGWTIASVLLALFGPQDLAHRICYIVSACISSYWVGVDCTFAREAWDSWCEGLR